MCALCVRRFVRTHVPALYARRRTDLQNLIYILRKISGDYTRTNPNDLKYCRADARHTRVSRLIMTKKR